MHIMDVELSCIGSDEEDKDEDNHGGDGNMQDKNRNEGQVSSTKHRKGDNNTNPIVKTEERHEPAPSKKSCQPHKTPSNKLHIYSAAELSWLNQCELLSDIQLLDGLFILVIYWHLLTFSFPEQLKRSKLNMAMLKEYQRCKEEFLWCAKDLDDMTALCDAEKQKYDSLWKQRLDKFMASFSTISLKLKKMYQVSAIISQLATTERSTW